MAASIATITGTALRPGVSANKRLYVGDGNVARAVARAQQRLADSAAPPLTMRISHPTDEPRAPVTEIVGRLTRIWQEADGRVGYEAAIADTPEGRTVKALVDNRNGQPYLKGVSIRGSWLGPTRRVMVDGDMCETATDLEFDGLDFTHRPGILGAGVESVTDPTPSQPDESAPLRTPIHESVEEALVTAPITEADAPVDTAPTAAVQTYADLGYRPDGQKRYPVGTVREARASWVAINEADNARDYTAKQLKRVRERVVKALRGYGVEVDRGGVLVTRGPVTEAAAMAYENPASFSVNLDNGMVCVNVSSWRIDPHDLDMVARAAMQGACAALAAIDPDTDGDIDLPGAPDTDELESAPAARPVESAPAAPAATEPVTPAPDPAADPITETEAPGMTEPTNTTAVAASPAAAPTVTLSEDQFAALLARFAPPAAAPVEAAPAAAAVVEAAPAPVAAAPVASPVVETEDQRIARLVEAAVQARLTEAVQAQVAQNGPPTRKGLVGRVTEAGELTTTADAGSDLNEHGMPADWPNKPLHQFTADERGKYLSRAMFDHVTTRNPR